MTVVIESVCEELNNDFIQPATTFSSLAYILAAVLCARPWVRGKGVHGLVSLQTLFIALTAAIGITSFVFHFLKDAWAYYLHTIPIIVFVIAYIAVAVHEYLGFKPMLSFIVSLSAGSVVCSFTYATPKFAFFPIPLFMVLIAAGAYFNMSSRTGANLIYGAAILSLAIVLRWLDQPLCTRFRFGLHSFWHLTSAFVIWWLIRIHRRHPLERNEESSVSS